MTSRQALERRARSERRMEDRGPPVGVDDRRHCVERRFPQVEHVDFDEHIEIYQLPEQFSTVRH